MPTLRRISRSYGRRVRSRGAPLRRRKLRKTVRGSYKSKCDSRTVKKIVNVAISKSQEQKQHPIDMTTNTAFNKAQFGINLIPGNSITNRVGDSVHLKGVRIEYQFENRSTSSGTVAQPLEFCLYVVETKLNQNPETVWYLGDKNIPSSFEGVTSDAFRITQRKNTEDIKFIYGKVFKTQATATNQSGPQMINGNVYVPIKKDIKWDDESPTVPYSQIKVKPNIFVIMYVLAPTYPPLYNTPVTSYWASVKTLWYYRE